jgi:hypothetical protein
VNDKGENAEPGPGWEVGVDRYRDATKWVIAAFGSIGALTVAAVPLARLSDNEIASLPLLTAGVAVAVGGSLLAIIAALWNIAPQAVYPGDVKQAERGRLKRWLWGHARLEHKLHEAPAKFLPTGVSTLADLDPAIDGLERLAARQAVLGTTDPTNKEASAASYERLEGLRRTRRQINGLARFEQARSRFRASLTILVFAAIVTVTGLAIATYGLVNSSDQPIAKLDESAPRTVSIVMTPVGRDTLGSQLGESCVADDIAAIVLAGDPASDAWEVVTIGTPACPTARFTMTATLGTIF